MRQDAWGAVIRAMDSWHQAKLFVEHSVSVSHDTLHLLVGVLIWMVIGLLGGRSLSSWRPWLWLLALVLWNEAVDLWVEQWPDPGEQYGEGFKDLVLTMVMPTIIMAATRFRPELFRQSRLKQ